MTYSQNFEEEILLNACAGVKMPGYILDLGANDGVTLSNSRALIEKGWEGCLIEPDYEAFGKLAKLYAGQKGIKLINAAVDTEGGVKTFHHSKDGGLCSSIQKTVWTPEYHIQEYSVVAITPSQIIDQMPRGPDVITCDIEGRSFDVVAQFPYGSWVVKAICVEHDHRAEEIGAWAREKGYRVCELNAENIILVRR